MKTDPFADPVARSIRRRGHQKPATFLSIPKAKGIISCESRLEATLASVAILDPRVLRIRPQPMTFDLNTGRHYRSRDVLTDLHARTSYKPKIFTPDLEAILADHRQVLLEAKHTAWIDRKMEYLDYPDILRKFGFGLLIVTEELLEGPLEYNVRLLRNFVGSARQPGLWAGLPDLPIARAEIEAKYGIGKADTFRGVVAGDLECCLKTDRIGPHTLMRKAAGSTKHLELLPL